MTHALFLLADILENISQSNCFLTIDSLFPRMTMAMAVIHLSMKDVLNITKQALRPQISIGLSCEPLERS